MRRAWAGWVRGDRAGPGTDRLRGGVDEPRSGDRVHRGPVTVQGWSVWDDRPALAVALRIGDQVVARVPVGSCQRPDVADALGDPRLASAGWSAEIDLAGQPDDQAVTLRVSVWGDPAAAPVELPPITLVVDGPAADPDTGRGTRGDPSTSGTERFDALESRLAALEASRGEQAQGLTGHTEWLQDLERWVSSCVKTLASLGAQPVDDPRTSVSGSLDVAGSLMRRLEVTTVMDWVDRMGEVSEGPTVSVAMATRDRPELLRQALDSVLTQTYPRLEVIVVDDSEGTETAQLLGAVDDPRVRVLRTAAHRGAGFAFNAGLEAVTGDIVAFLDDDNVMHPEWLRSVVWALSSFPEVDALYGARVIEDPGAQHANRSGMMPLLEFSRYERDRHEKANFIDRNTIAFRARYARLRYDETLRAAFDWDHSLRLFAEAVPLALPVISCYYRTVVAGRLSDIPEQSESVRRVRARAHTYRPLRILVHTAMYPVISETYIGEDIASLEEAGAEVTVTAVQQAVSATAGVAPARLDVDEAIAEAHPDVALLHWTTHAEGEIRCMEAHDLPFACRVHSFDVDVDRVAKIMAHPLCVGVFAHPHHVAQLPGARPLLPVVGPATVIPESPLERTLVLSVSAGLPKKDFPLLIEAMRRVPELDRAIVLGRTNGLEDLPDQVVELAGAADPGIDVLVNVPRSDVLELMARALVLVYTLEPGGPMGFPMSVIEAMLSGAVPILPDRSESRAVVGEDVRTYRDVADIVRHVHQVAAGGPEISEERRQLRERARRHRDQGARRRLYDELRDALTEWRYRPHQ